MADTEHYVRDDVRGFLDMLEAMGGKGVEEVGAEEARQQMRAMGAVAEAEPRTMAVQRDLTCPGPAGPIPLRLYDVQAARAPGPAVRQALVPMHLCPVPPATARRPPRAP